MYPGIVFRPEQRMQSLPCKPKTVSSFFPGEFSLFHLLLFFQQPHLFVITGRLHKLMIQLTSYRMSVPRLLRNGKRCLGLSSITAVPANFRVNHIYTRWGSYCSFRASLKYLNW